MGMGKGHRLAVLLHLPAQHAAGQRVEADLLAVGSGNPAGVSVANRPAAPSRTSGAAAASSSLSCSAVKRRIQSSRRAISLPIHAAGPV